MPKKYLSTQQLTYARSWLQNCTRPNFDLNDDQVATAIEKHYFGGIKAFVTESSHI